MALIKMSFYINAILYFSFQCSMHKAVTLVYRSHWTNIYIYILYKVYIYIYTYIYNNPNECWMHSFAVSTNCSMANDTKFVKLEVWVH